MSQRLETKHETTFPKTSTTSKTMATVPEAPGVGAQACVAEAGVAALVATAADHIEPAGAPLSIRSC
jgi:hypothetical protein